MLYNDAFSIIYFTMFGNFLAETYSPNILLIEENTVSLCYPYRSALYFSRRPFKII